MRKVLKIFTPFLIIFVVTPIYNFLDRLILVKVFGCGCVPSAQSNMLNIAFNANDLRLLVYSLLTMSMVALALIFSKTFTTKFLRFLYAITVLGVNAAISILIYRTMMWG